MDRNNNSFDENVISVIIFPFTLITVENDVALQFLTSPVVGDIAQPKGDSQSKRKPLIGCLRSEYYGICI